MLALWAAAGPWARPMPAAGAARPLCAAPRARRRRAAPPPPPRAALGAAALDPAVLGPALGASYKLLLICSAVGWLLRAGRLPPATAAVLSQASFQLLIPAMLFTRVAAAAAAAPDAALLGALAAAALGQVAVGAAWGALLAPLADGPPKWWRAAAARARPSAAAAIAAAAAAAAGAPRAAAALLPRPPPPARGARALVAAGCAFGNSFTLPAVFFLTLLPPPLADAAIAYCGLFLLAWSPAMWSVGLSIVEGGFGPAEGATEGAEGAAGGGGAAAAVVDVGGRPRGARRAALAAVARRVLNPPVVAILAGAALGLAPPGRALLAGLGLGGAGAPAAAALPLELGLARAAARGAYETVELLAGGTLAVQTLVLASSLLQPAELAPGAPAPAPRAHRSWLGAARALLLPADAAEARALAVLAAARFVLVPLTCVALFRAAAARGLVGPLSSQPLLLFVVAVQSVMPPAQNLVLMLQLSERTRPAAPAFARTLLKLYAYAALPVTLWVSAFAGGLGIPVLRA
jgi:predicted permease